MKAYKIELLVIDFDELGQLGIEQEIENVNYPNDCISPQIWGIKEVDIGEWSDDHPMNNSLTKDEYYEKYIK